MEDGKAGEGTNTTGTVTESKKDLKNKNWLCRNGPKITLNSPEYQVENASLNSNLWRRECCLADSREAAALKILERPEAIVLRGNSDLIRDSIESGLMDESRMGQAQQQVDGRSSTGDLWPDISSYYMKLSNIELELKNPVRQQCHL